MQAICTSALLRTSTRVSSGFILCGHSSPSFGSQLVCFHSGSLQQRARWMLQGAGAPLAPQARPVRVLPFQFAHWLQITIALAYKLDSLVRVSRREGGRHRCSSDRVRAARRPAEPRSFDAISTLRDPSDAPLRILARVPRVGACAANGP